MRAGIGLHYLDLAHYQGGGGAFEPSSLFGDTDTGGFYDPSDLTSMHSHSAGTAAATELWPNVSVGDSVGMILDKSQMGGSTAESYVDTLDVLGELDNAGFDTDTDWTKGTGWTISGGTANASAATGNLLQNLNADLAADKVYYVEVEVVTATSGSFAINVGGTQQTSEISTVGVHSSIVHTGSSGNTILYFIPSTFTGSIDNVVIKEIPGNHLVAPSDAARPILRDEIVDGVDVDVSGQPELVTNGTFDDDTGWTEGGDWSISGGEASCTTAPSNLERNADSDFTGGAWHLISIEKTGGSTTGAGVSVSIGGFDTEDIITTGSQPAGTYKLLKRAEAVDPDLVRIAKGGSSEVIIDNVSVKEVPAEASRRYYLEFDGTDDILTTGSVFGTSFNNGPATHCFAFQDVGNDTGGYFYTVAAAANDGGVRGANSSSGLRIYNEAGSYEGITGTDPGTDDPFVATIVIDSASSASGRHNGASGNTIDPTDNWFVSGAEGIAICSDDIDGFNVIAEANYYGSCTINRQLTTLERQNLEIYLANKSGVTLDATSGYTFPGLLYDANTDGGFYDPSDLTSMGTARPSSNSYGVGADRGAVAGDTIGYLLDKSQMGGMTADAFVESQDDLAADIDLTSASGWTEENTGGGGSISFGAGGLTLTDDTTNGAMVVWSDDTNLYTVGEFYEITVTKTSAASATQADLTIRCGNNQGFQIGNQPPGTYSRVMECAGVGALRINTGAAGTSTHTVSAITIKHIPGNHLVAPSDAARPVLRDEIVDGTDVDVSSATELWPQPDYDASTGVTLGGGGEWVISGGVATATAVPSGSTEHFSTDDIVTANKWHLFEFEIVSRSAGSLSLGTNENNGTSRTNAGVYKELILPTTDLKARFYRRASDFTGVIDNVSVKEVPASADRRYWLEFDGTDDGMETALTVSGPLSVGTGCRSYSAASLQVIWSASAATQADTYADFRDTAAGTGILAVTAYAAAFANQASINSSAVYDEAWTAGVVQLGQDDFSHRLDGDVIGTDTSGTWPDNNATEFSIGHDTAGANDAEVDIAGIAALTRKLTYAEREELEAYIGRKAGTIDFDTAWHPASLFENSEDGAVYDVSLASSLFQERTGASATTPASIGDPVGTILDQSGNGNHAVAPSDAARPCYSAILTGNCTWTTTEPMMS